MKNAIRVMLLGLFYLSLVAAEAHAAQEVRFRLVRDAFAVVSLHLNGAGPFDFILDTGTNTTLIEPQTAAQLSLVPLDRMTLTTPVGKQVLARSSLRKVELGSVTAGDVEVLVQELPALRGLDSRIHGILGQNFLAHFNYLIDYRHHRLLFESQNEFRDLSSIERVPLEQAGSMVIQSELPFQRKATIRLLLDSAASAPVLFSRAGGGNGIPLSRGMSLVDARNHSRAVTTIQIETLTIADQHLHNLKVAVVPAEEGESRPEDGLLPTSLFSAIYINNSEGFVVINPRF